MPTRRRRSARNAYSLIEILIVVVNVAILAATIGPQIRDTTNDAKFNTTVFNLQAMRAEIERYRALHGTPPASLELILRSGSPRDSGEEFGPNMGQIPHDHLSNTNEFNISGSSPIKVNGETGGWIYDPVLGELRINHFRYCDL